MENKKVNKYECYIILKDKLVGKEHVQEMNNIENYITSTNTNINPTKLIHQYSFGSRKLGYNVLGYDYGYYLQYDFETTRENKDQIGLKIKANENVIKYLIFPVKDFAPCWD